MYNSMHNTQVKPKPMTNFDIHDKENAGVVNGGGNGAQQRPIRVVKISKQRDGKDYLEGVEDKENRGGRQDSAEKWRGKYLQEKERLQQTIEMLEKTNQGYFSQVMEKTDLVENLNKHRQANEALMEKVEK